MASRPADARVPAHRDGEPRLSSRRRPDRLPGIVDSHAHLQHHRFDGSREAVLERATVAGIERILVPGWDLASSEGALELAERHAPLVDAAVGIHPHHAADADEAAWRQLDALLADSRTRAVGEIGLDHFRVLAPTDVQLDVFRRQLALAAQHELPVLVHDRDAHEAIAVELLAWTGARRGVVHAFSGDAAMAQRLSAAGYLVSFALPLAFRSAAGPREAAPRLPLGSFLVETDAPYLGPDRERTNEPTTVLRVVSELAKLRGVEPADLVDPVRVAYERLLAGTTSARSPA